MHTKWNEPSTLNVARFPKASARKAVNSAASISPQAIGKGAMADGAKTGRVTIDRHIVRRVGEHGRGALLAPINVAKTAASRALPHNRRWRPRTHKSPILVIG